MTIEERLTLDFDNAFGEVPGEGPADLCHARGLTVMEFDSTPRFITNSKSTGDNLLTVLREQFAVLSEGDTFDFCVAFVSEGGLTCLVQILSEINARNIHGRLLTSTYLNFNTPDVYRKLMGYSNIETRVYQENLHAKGYMFNTSNLNTVIVGSSNLTDRALTCNKEWNVLFQSFDEDGAVGDLKSEFELLWNDALTTGITEKWIDGYEAYRKASQPMKSVGKSAFQVLENGTENVAIQKPLAPNKMQERALESLRALHARKERRALLVSATGTGKTYLSVFDVLEAKPERVLFLAHRRRILTASMRSYEKLLGGKYTYGMYAAGEDGLSATCTFAMCSTLSRYLDKIDPETFDYVVVDEAHRVGSMGYQKIFDRLKPKFWLGMTATPSRTDGFDVYSLFNHVIAYQITLQDALDNDMLAPFHYFGIADLYIDDVEQDDYQLFSKLTSEARVNHIIDKIEEYSVRKTDRKGLIFCSRKKEADALSAMFNERGYRTASLSGDDSEEARNKAIERLESGELEYIFSVDIMNEGVDIPSVNQIIMLRKTESAIVFVQQLGRGLRKDDSKDCTLVLDFIGNYQQNFLIPVALSGDHTYNKDRLRKIVKEGSSTIPGASTVFFDRVSEGRIYKAIDGKDFTEAKFIKDEYRNLRRMLGRIPALEEYDTNESIDPLLIFQKYGSYHAFLKSADKDYNVAFSKDQENILKFISTKLASGKRLEELLLIRNLMLTDGQACDIDDFLFKGSNQDMEAVAAFVASSARSLRGEFSAPNGFVPLLEQGDGSYVLSDTFLRCLENAEFRRQVLEVVQFGLHRYEDGYAQRYRDTAFSLYAKYTKEEVCRLLGWEKSESPLNIGGYMYNRATNTFPVFINYDKAPDISDSIKYEDRFVTDRELIAISKKNRYLTSNEIKRLQAWPDNGMRVYLFMRKSTNDKGSKEYYFLGEMFPTGAFKEVKTRAGEPAVEIGYRLETPVRKDIYEYMISTFEEG